jgi:nucleoid DNA-binding protein
MRSARVGSGSSLEPEKEEEKMAKKRAKAADRPLTRNEVYREIAAKTGMAKKDVISVTDSLADIIVKGVKKHGMFNYMGLLKLTLVRKPAVAGGKMIRNPFTGEMIRQKARPASRSVRVRPLKALKDLL